MATLLLLPKPGQIARHCRKKKGRLGPGQMIAVDLTHEVLENWKLSSALQKSNYTVNGWAIPCEPGTKKAWD